MKVLPGDWGRVVLIFFALSSLQAGTTELVVNGGFEKPLAPPVGYETYNAGSAFWGWSVASGDVDIVNTNYYASATGVQSLDLNGYGRGEVFQDVTTISGKSYRLSFALAANPVPRAGSGLPIKQVEVKWGTNVIATLSHDITGYTAENVGWRQFTFVVTGSGSDRLSFRSLTDGNAGSAIDDVSVTTEDTQVPVVNGVEIHKAVQVAFPTSLGKKYQVQWADKVDTSVWTYLGSPVTGNGKTNLICDPTDQAVRVYRVLELDPE
jgi:choice-of-anchor C domain-containing protein